VIYYNQTAIEKAGKELPKAGWTQAQQVELAKALTTADGKQFGYLPGITNIWKTCVTLFRSFGDQLLSEDGAKFQLNSEKGVQAVTYLYDLFQTHKVAPSPTRW